MLRPDSSQSTIGHYEDQGVLFDPYGVAAESEKLDHVYILIEQTKSREAAAFKATEQGVWQAILIRHLDEFWERNGPRNGPRWIR